MPEAAAFGSAVGRYAGVLTTTRKMKIGRWMVVYSFPRAALPKALQEERLSHP
jgi:hypothetical protein